MCVTQELYGVSKGLCFKPNTITHNASINAQGKTGKQPTRVVLRGARAAITIAATKRHAYINTAKESGRNPHRYAHTHAHALPALNADQL